MEPKFVRLLGKDQEISINLGYVAMITITPDSLIIHLHTGSIVLVQDPTIESLRRLKRGLADRD